MKKTYFDGAGFKAEHIAVKQFNGKLVTDLEQQYKDIDALLPTKKGVLRTCSIKDQLKSSKQYGSIQIETKLTNTSNERHILGCFYKNQSQMYFWRVWTEKYGDTWLIIKSSVLQNFVEENKEHLRTWRTAKSTEAKNRSYGRKYDRAEGYTIPIKDLEEYAQLKPVEK